MEADFTSDDFEARVQRASFPLLECAGFAGVTTAVALPVLQMHGQRRPKPNRRRSSGYCLLIVARHFKLMVQSPQSVFFFLRHD